MRTTVLLALLTLALPLTHADTLQFIGPGSNSTNGVYTYPYHFLVNGQPADLMCLSFDNEIVDGESWQATAAVPTTVPEREAAWLLNDTQTHPADASADNLAAWGLFSGDVPTDAQSDAQLALAEAGEGSINAWRFLIYTPANPPNIENGNGGSAIPQTFIREVSSPVPEPGSLTLMGLGLALLALGGRRRLARQTKRV